MKNMTSAEVLSGLLKMDFKEGGLDDDIDALTLYEVADPDTPRCAMCGYFKP